MVAQLAPPGEKRDSSRAFHHSVPQGVLDEPVPPRMVCRLPSLAQFGLPDLPDSLELALDAAAGQAQSVGNLFIPMALELALGNCAQPIVVEHTHQTLILFHYDRQHFRRRGIAQNVVEPRAATIAVAYFEQGIASNPAAATLLLLEQALLVDHFPDG
jgi:hypothetical protein